MPIITAARIVPSDIVLYCTASALSTLLRNTGQQGQQKRSSGLRLSLFRKHDSSEDDQELSIDEIRTLGVAGSGVCSLDASTPPLCRRAATQYCARPLKSAQAKRRRVHRNSPASVTLHKRPRLESIDESSEATTGAIAEARNPPPVPLACPFCGEVFSRKTDLFYHLVEHHSDEERSGLLSVAHVEYGQTGNDEEPLPLAPGQLPSDFFVPPTLGDATQNDAFIGGWKAAAFPPMDDVSDEPSVFTAKLGDHHGPRLAPSISAFQVRIPPVPEFVGRELEAMCIQQQENETGGQDGDNGNSEDAGSVDFEHVEYVQQEGHLSSGFADNGGSKEILALPRVFPRTSTLTSTISSRSLSSRRFPSIESVMYNDSAIESPFQFTSSVSSTSIIANANSGTRAGSVRPAVVRQPLTDDDESDLSWLMDDDESDLSCRDGGTRSFEISPVLS
ncbi:hypothetical protein E4U61_004556 [Claviceps capensis]|nr:hypothetical protein E4U61_004556 [Claviceps capensis]